MQNFVGSSDPGIRLAGISIGEVWDPASRYKLGAIVLDRAGFWLAVNPNHNSRPISGNADWTLVGGTPYVDVVFDPVALTTAPFFSSPFSNPGAVLVPAPGAGFTLYSPRIYTTVTDGEAWGNSAAAQVFYGDPTDGNEVFPNTTSDQLNATDLTATPAETMMVGTDLASGGLLTTPIANKPIVIQSQTDLIASGPPIGTRSLIVRTYYTIIPTTGFSLSAFFSVSAVNQGTKTLTVSGDATSVTTFSIVGSTGNNQTFTKVSATFDTDHTDIVVVQSIPSATADGWVRK